MATNGEIPAGDTEMAESEDVVTMVDVLKEQQDFEANANAVLGGSDDKECTYSKGYIKRQAIYACVTCCSESKDDPSKRAGICLACGLNCHENHELIELYTKRNFRCDCGNPKFKTPCQFTPNKPELNEDNIYNQNFIGLYCSCSKPYPEPTFDDLMIQCIICEDWWHATHLDLVGVPTNPNQDSEMICKLCITKNEFLHDYSDLALETEYVEDAKVNGADSNTESEEKLSNGSLMDEKLVNGVSIDEKLAIGIKEGFTSNDMDTSTTETNKATPANNNESEASSTEKESTETENKVESLIEGEENKSVASTDTDETNKAAVVLTEVNSEHKLGTSPGPSGNKAELAFTKTEEPSSTFEDKTEKSDDSEEKMDKSTVSAENIDDNRECTDSHLSLDDKLETSPEPSDDKAEVASIEKAEEPRLTFENKTEGSVDFEVKKDQSTVSADNVEDNSESADSHLSLNEETIAVAEEMADNAEPTENENERSAQASGNPAENVSKATNKSSENMDITESKVIEDKNTDENMEIGGSKVTDDKENVAKEEENAMTSQSLYPSADTDKPSIETNENSSDKAESAVTSQDDDMNDISNEKDTVSEDVNKIDEPADDSKENDSSENKRKIDEDISDDISVKKPKLDDTKCVRPKGGKKVLKGATFWNASFRQKLCTCGECISMYKDLNVLFLTDMEDTVIAYEALGKEKTAGKLNQYEKGLAALCSLGRIQQIEALTEYNKMRDKLLTFLQSFKEKKEIVTENDIKTFFAGMKPEKRMDGVYFCG